MKDRNYLMYFVTIVVVICVYIVIHLFGSSIKIGDSGYEYNVAKQPINSILSIYDNGGSNNQNEGKVFIYDYDENNYISIYNQFPIEDKVGISRVGDKYTNDFKLRFNRNAIGVKYTITLEKLPESDLEDDWLKVYLSLNGIGLQNCYHINGKIRTYDEYIKYKNKDDERILYQGIVTYADILKGYNDFTLKLWINENVKVVDEYPSKTANVRINVYAVE